MKPAATLVAMATVATTYAALSLAATTAHADPRSAREAERLFAQGRTLDTQGRADEACTKYQQSETLDPAVGTLLNLGTCAERKGQTATALHRYREAAALAARQADAKREALANRAAQALESRQAVLVVRAPKTPLAPGTTLQRDDETIAPTELGVATSVDPGTHVIRMEIPGRAPWSQTVTVAPGPVLVAVQLPELATPASSSVSSSGAATAAPPPLPPVVTPDAPSNDAPAPPPAADADAGAPRTSRTALTPVAIAVGAVGVVGLGVGTYFAFHSRGEWNDVTQVCGGGHCSTQAMLTAQSPNESAAARDGNIATGLLIAGGVALVAGVVLYLVDAPAHKVDAARLLGNPLQGSF